MGRPGWVGGLRRGEVAADGGPAAGGKVILALAEHEEDFGFREVGQERRERPERPERQERPAKEPRPEGQPQHRNNKPRNNNDQPRRSGNNGRDRRG